MTEIKDKKWIKNYIKLVIDEVKDVPKSERGKVQFRIKMSMKHKTFSEKFPSLLMMVVEEAEDLDMDRLDKLLDLMDSVQKGEKDGEEVDKKLGQEYFDKYVAPNIDTSK